MKHLIISREFPPSTYPMGGIGTYVGHIARLLAEHGETVHVIAERWIGAPGATEVLLGGRLVTHRVWTARPLDNSATPHEDADALDAMAASPFPAQAFGWQAARLAEQLVVDEGIDVIEGQDFEAPLYDFLVRRALGLGPTIMPPCVVHLHTTYEQVCRANAWRLDTPRGLAMKAQEDYVIRAADALLAPSRFLARQTEAQYDLPADSIATIPYPIGEVPRLERTMDTWSGGSICFAGRYEVRKGLLEWVPAAVQVAARRPGLRFEFIGADTPLEPDDPSSSVRSRLRALVPADLARAFVFGDPVNRMTLWARLERARIAVVPSRWENFPNACIEAMSSGLPVLVTPNGGMAEMIEEGRTGWVAASNAPGDLAQALERALGLAPQQLAAMGDEASRTIRERCDNDRTVARQLEFRRTVVARGATTSRRVPEGCHPAGPLATLPTPTAQPAAAAEASVTHRGTAETVRLAISHPLYAAGWLVWRGRRLLRRRVR
jgi:glycosyltransferase involved in cell wall biosynthesis